MFKLSAISLILTLASGFVFGGVGHMRNVGPSGHPQASYHTADVELIRPTTSTAPAVPEFGLDIHANRPHKAKVTRQWVCGQPENMAGTWDGLGYSFYGRVARCEWM